MMDVKEQLTKKFNRLFQQGYVPLIFNRGNAKVIQFQDIELLEIEENGHTIYLANFQKRPTHFFSEDDIKFMIHLIYNKMNHEDIMRHKIYTEKDKSVLPQWLEKLD